MKDNDYARLFALGIPLLRDEPMKKHTTFQIGGCADVFMLPKSKADVLKLLAICREDGLPYFVLGNGSNLLVRDEGFRGAIISTSGLSAVEFNGNTVTAEAGISLSALANQICAHHLTGFEFASGIPGSLGGAVYMNAGAYDGEIKDVFLSTECVDEGGNVVTLTNEEMEFAYRRSAAQDRNLTILSATLRLRAGNADDIKAKMSDFNKRRKEKQPLEMPSAGSTFRRPEGFFAGKLIMDSGLSGCRIGGAMVSEKHSGFVVNAGNATAQDVTDLIAHIQNVVNEKYGVTLQPEVKQIGV